MSTPRNTLASGLPTAAFTTWQKLWLKQLLSDPNNPVMFADHANNADHATEADHALTADIALSQAVPFVTLRHAVDLNAEFLVFPLALPTASYIPVPRLSWNGVAWASALSTASVRFDFDVAPIEDAFLDLTLYFGVPVKTRFTLVVQAIGADVNGVTIALPLSTGGYSFDGVANWNTRWKVTSQTLSQVVLEFLTQAPAAGGLFYLAAQEILLA